MHLNQTARSYPTILLLGGTLVVQTLAIAGAYSAHWLLRGEPTTAKIVALSSSAPAASEPASPRGQRSVEVPMGTGTSKRLDDTAPSLAPHGEVESGAANSFSGEPLADTTAGALALQVAPKEEQPLPANDPIAETVAEPQAVIPAEPANGLTRAAPPAPALEAAPERHEEPIPQASESPNTPPARQQARHKIKQGDNLTSIWAEHGAPRAGAIKAGRAFAEANVPTSGLRLGEQLILDFSADGTDIVRLERKLRDGRRFILEGSASRGYSARFETPATREAERVVSGQVESSFSRAALTAGIPYPVVDELVDVLGSRITFDRNLQPGDSFTVRFRERELLDAPGEILETEEAPPLDLAAIEAGGELYVAIRHVDAAGVAHYYDEQGKRIGDSFLRYPVRYSRISSTFSKARFHPVLGRARPHNGVDFAAPIGTPVRSVGDGVVVAAGWQKGTGQMVRIRHGERYMTEYFHLSKIAQSLRVGSRVTRGEVIGAVGMTGLATGPHLHFGFFERGTFVNPLEVKLPLADQNEMTLPQPILRAALETLGSYQQDTRLAGILEQLVKAAA